MSRQTTVRCDNCGAEKRKSNHWYLVSGPTPDDSSISIYLEDVEDATFMEDVCGETCLHEIISKLLHQKPVTGVQSQEEARANHASIQTANK